MLHISKYIIPEYCIKLYDNERHIIFNTLTASILALEKEVGDFIPPSLITSDTLGEFFVEENYDQKALVRYLLKRDLCNFARPKFLLFDIENVKAFEAELRLRWPSCTIYLKDDKERKLKHEGLIVKCFPQYETLIFGLVPRDDCGAVNRVILKPDKVTFSVLRFLQENGVSTAGVLEEKFINMAYVIDKKVPSDEEVERWCIANAKKINSTNRY
ncbi:hypothetical protein BK816_07290 [Boudabousia tangfeifanii]|uniref:Uncharacterized protein n=1 Tax=Boudabousia tangfeifanii TaxID=1912795 RepID=A0A1D9MLQ8_9ACTO|nr:hypothetical protein [Boudabousia tangfeifanii]AOZ73119.1 hypothetical protein BK816_07290 [Boudabousia tangfeifanii]